MRIKPVEYDLEVVDKPRLIDTFFIIRPFRGGIAQKQKCLRFRPRMV